MKILPATPQKYHRERWRVKEKEKESRETERETEKGGGGETFAFPTSTMEFSMHRDIIPSHRPGRLSASATSTRFVPRFGGRDHQTHHVSLLPRGTSPSHILRSRCEVLLIFLSPSESADVLHRKHEHHQVHGFPGARVVVAQRLNHPTLELLQVRHLDVRLKESRSNRFRGSCFSFRSESASTTR